MFDKVRVILVVLGQVICPVIVIISPCDCIICKVY